MALLEAGKLCASCIGGKCKELPTAEQPTELNCPTCEGVGCDECNGGSYTVTQCPYRYSGSRLELSHYCGLFETGLPPVSGGVLDQANWFIEGQRQLTRERNKIRTSEATGIHGKR